MQAALFTKFLSLSQHRQCATLIVSQALDASLRHVGNDHCVGRAVFVHAAQRRFEMRESLLDLVELVRDARQKRVKQAGLAGMSMESSFNEVESARAGKPRVGVTSTF